MKSTKKGPFLRVKYQLLLAIILHLALYSTSASAETIVCNTCSSQSMESTARGHAISGWSRGSSVNKTYYIVDNNNTVVRKYQVSVQDDFRDPMYWDNPQGYILSIYSGLVEEEILQYMQLRAESIDQPYRIDLPSNGNLPINAYADIENPNYSIAVSEYIMSRPVPGTLQRLSLLIEALDGIIGFDSSKLSKLYFFVNYAGGQSALYEYDPKKRRLVRINNSSKDDSGNIIPEQRDDVAPPGGSVDYNFDFLYPNDIQEFFDRMALFDVPIYNSQGTRIISPGGGGCSYTCSAAFVNDRWIVSCISKDPMICN